MKMAGSFLAGMTVAVVFGGLVASVRADDIYPPPWPRGQPYTTYQDWTFKTAANPVAPDVGVFNPYGNPTATIYSGSWSALYNNHVGVWNFGQGTNAMTFHIPNAPSDATRHKELRMQITLQSDYGGPLFVWANGVSLTLVQSTPVGTGGWLQNVYEILLPTNPSSEDVVMMDIFPLRVGEVVIDTICIPEPSFFALAGLGVAMLMIARRRS